MKRKNRIIGTVTALVCALGVLSSCSASTGEQAQSSSGGSANADGTSGSAVNTAASDGEFKYGHKLKISAHFSWLVVICRKARK